MRAALASLAVVTIAVGPAGTSSRAEAAGFEVERFSKTIDGKIRGVRAADVDGDGKPDLVLLVERKAGEGAARQDVVVLRTPATPDPKAFFADSAAVVIPCDGPDAGARAHAAAVAIGRFGDGGAIRLRFLGTDGVSDVALADGKVVETKVAGPTLLARGPGAPLAFWSAVADLDGDGKDECWWPDASGRVRVGALELAVVDEAQRGPNELFIRKSRAASLTAADIFGDGKKSLVRLDGTALVIESPGVGGAPAGKSLRVELPFLAPDPSRPPEQLHSPRLTLADVDGDGKTDLLVTLVHGRADKLGDLRTSLYHVAGPFVDAKTGALAKPKARIDTESVALHPRFVDVTGDGKLDYVADSIRGTMVDLVKRVMGTEPEITYTIVRYSAETGTFEKSPYATFARPYSGAEARGNRFGRSGWFEADFDGDGVRDLLDLGNLRGFAIWRGAAGGDDAFGAKILPRVAIEGDKDLASETVLVDLTGDGRPDAVMWTESTLLVLAGKGAK